MGTVTQMAEVRDGAEDAAAMAAELTGLGFALIDTHDLDAAAVRSIPLLQRLVRARLVVAEMANRVRPTNEQGADVLVQASRAIGEVTIAVEQGRLITLLLDETAAASTEHHRAVRQRAAGGF